MHPDLVKSALSAAGINIDSARIFSLSKELESLACKYGRGFEVDGAGWPVQGGPRGIWRSVRSDSGLAGVRAAPKTSAELAAAAAKAEVAEQLAAEKKTRVDKLEYQLGLANATLAVLRSIMSLDSGVVEITAQGQYAVFRKDLAPLVADYGYKIVLVGDKSRATLSK